MNERKSEPLKEGAMKGNINRNKQKTLLAPPPPIPPNPFDAVREAFKKANDHVKKYHGRC